MIDHLPFGLDSHPWEKLDPDDEAQTSLFDFEDTDNDEDDSRA